MGLWRPEPGEPVWDRVRRVVFFVLLVLALCVIFYGVTGRMGSADVPDLGW